MNKWVYTIDDIYEGESKELAQDYPEAWDEFLTEMEGKQYSKDPLNDAWSWFATGWLRSIKGFLGEGW